MQAGSKHAALAIPPNRCHASLMTMPTTHARVDVGMPAPDFALAESGGRRVSLSELRGQPAILAFYPPEWDPSRADQLAHFNWLVRQVPGVDAELLGISMDGIWCELAFAGDDVRVPLLADLDPHGAVAERYGVRGGQALFVVDAAGVIAWRHAGHAGSTPDSGELLSALEALAEPTPEQQAARFAPRDESWVPVAPCAQLPDPQG